MAGMSRTAPGDRGGSMSRDGGLDPATDAFLAHRSHVSWSTSSASAAEPSIS